MARTPYLTKLKRPIYTGEILFTVLQPARDLGNLHPYKIARHAMCNISNIYIIHLTESKVQDPDIKDLENEDKVFSTKAILEQKIQK